MVPHPHLPPPLVSLVVFYQSTLNPLSDFVHGCELPEGQGSRGRVQLWILSVHRRAEAG